MTKTKFPVLQVLLFYTVALTIFNFTRAPAYSNQSSSSKIRFIQPTLKNKPANRGAPGDRKGAGTRGDDCPLVNKPELTALVPLMQINRKPNQQETTNSSSKDLSSKKVALGLTTLEYPSFWFYFPYKSNDIKSLKFVLLDDNNNPVTKEPISINLPDKPGAVNISLPKTEKPLEIDRYYHWYFLVDCNPESGSEDTAVEGLVKRVSPKPDLQRQLQAATTTKQKVAIYARSGIWQDAITLLAQLRREKPQDTTLLTDWQDLLQSIDLENIAREPITNCCNNNKKITSKSFE